MDGAVACFPAKLIFVKLRDPILALGDAFASSGGWGLERAFFKWWYRLPVGSLFPRPLKLQFPNATWFALSVYRCVLGSEE